MASLEAYGRPAFLIVPSDKHRLDAKIWKDRYPLMQVVAPEGARAKVTEIEPVIEDTNALRLQLLQWAEIESLKRILVSHGSINDENPRQTLRNLARSNSTSC